MTRRPSPPPGSLLLAGFALLLPALPASAQVSVLTRNYDNQRTGANLSETILNVSNVNPAQFGKVFTLRVDDQVYAGILYVPNLTIGTGTHNVIYVATVNNTVYAFDADTLGPPLWQRNFNGAGRPTRNSEVGQACGTYRDYIGNIGLVGTPVIDGAAQTMYFLTRTVEGTATVQRLRAIDIRTGADRPGSPQVIQASVSGTGEGSSGGMVAFNPLMQNQRSGLALSQGLLYISWSSFCDTRPYHGWMMTYDAASLAQVGVFNTTPNGNMAAIWMSGAAAAFDADGNVYASTGNGSFNGVDAFGQSMVKLSPGSLSLVDYFTPSNFQFLNNTDLDFGSGAPVILPGTNRLVTGGKEGKLYLLDTTNMGHVSADDTQIPQVFQAVDTSIRPGGTHNIHNTTNAWNGPQGRNVYVWGENDFLHGYHYRPLTGTLELPAFASGSVLPPLGMPGGHLMVSSNGSQPGTGIVWATLPRNGDANQLIVPGQLVAFDAETLALLWTSSGPGDDVLNFAKGSPPIVANGKVYVASQSNFVSVYGLRTGPAPTENLALNRPATGSEPCDPGQTPDKAFNGSAQAGPDDKWCSAVPTPFLQVDLGANFSLMRFVVMHAGAGGEAFGNNTRDYMIQASIDGTHFQTVTNVTGSFLSITTHDIFPVVGRYVRLLVRGPRPASIYELEVYGSPAPATPDFLVSATPDTQTVTVGEVATYEAAITPFSGFSDTVTLAVSGLPTGATASFQPGSISGSGTSTLTVSTAGASAFGTFGLTITATSGLVTHTTVAFLTVNRNATGAAEVDLSSAFGIIGITSDGTPFDHGGLDGGGSAYSGNLLGTEQTFTGIPFHLGPPDVPNAIGGGTTVPLPAGQFESLGVLATAINGNAPNAIFTVRYTDGTTAPMIQGTSDWFTPQGYAGEALAVAMPYRNNGDGMRDDRPFNLYAYFLPLDPAKTVLSISVAEPRVRVLALTLLPSPLTQPDFALSASPSRISVAPLSTASATITIAPLRGFVSPVQLSLSPLPRGVTAFLVQETPLTSTLTLSIQRVVGPGNLVITVTGTAPTGGPGSVLQRTTRIILEPRPAAATSVPVDLSSAFLRPGVYNNGSVFNTGGFDGGGAAYSAQGLGPSLTFDGSLFNFGPPNVPNVVPAANQVVTLPAGSFSALKMIAAAGNGSQPGQAFTVLYSDGASDTFTQGISDWVAQGSFAGEFVARNTGGRTFSDGSRGTRPALVYGYVFPLKGSRTVIGLALPNNANVGVLALTLVPAP